MKLGFLPLILVACAGSPGAQPDPDAGRDATTCPLDATARAAVAHTIRSEVANTSWALENASPTEVGWALVLPGSETVNIARASLMFPCDAPATYAPYCSADAEGELQTCSRLGCEAPGVHRASAWFADAAHADGAEDRHPLTWTATVLGGTASATENPRVTWYADISSVPEVWASVAHGATLEIDGATWDLSYTGSLEARHAETPTLDVALGFPGLSADGPVEIAVVGVGDTLAGRIDVDGGAVGTIGMAPDGELTFAWSAACTE